MTLLLAIVLRTSAVLLAGLALRAVLSARSAAVRHAVLVATLLGAAAVVPISLVTPPWMKLRLMTITIPAPAKHRPATARAVGPASAPETATASAAVATATTPAPAVTTTPAETRETVAVSAAALVWACGSLVALGLLAAAIIRLSRVAARASRVTDDRWLRAARSVAEDYRLRREPVLLVAESPFVLATWGVRPARVLLPPDAHEWTGERIHAVLCHELAHVARADWLVQIGAQIVVSALWWNPLAWIACRHLRRDSEQACDNAVLGRGIGPADYAGHLVALARLGRARWSPFMPAVPMARRSAFERRISAMLNPRLDRRPVSRRAVAAIMGLLVAVTLTSAALRAAQAPPAALTGTVYDPTGGVMPGVAVTLEDPQQRTSQATTDASGRFSFAGIGSGRYQLSAKLPGFRSLSAQIELKSVADWDRALTLQVGALTETITVRESRIPTVVPPASATAAPVRLRVGGNIRAPRKTLDVKPVYPTSMRAAGREGQVPIEATIGADGSVTSVRVLSAQVHPDFAIAAVDAVRQWRFTPTLLNGQPVEVVMTVTVTFSLSD